jgi:hypothetical protein
MTKSRGTKEYRDRCRSFVNFTVTNCRTPDGFIVCLCRTCRLNKRHLPDLVYDCLTRGKECGPNTKIEFIMARSLYKLLLKALMRIVWLQMRVQV